MLCKLDILANETAPYLVDAKQNPNQSIIVLKSNEPESGGTVASFTLPSVHGVSLLLISQE